MPTLRKFTYYYKNNKVWGPMGPYSTRSRGTRKIYIYAQSVYRIGETFNQHFKQIKEYTGRRALTIFDIQGAMDLSKPVLTPEELKVRLMGRR